MTHGIDHTDMCDDQPGYLTEGSLAGDSKTPDATTWKTIKRKAIKARHSNMDDSVTTSMQARERGKRV
jgi:hypothetical protein